MCEYNIEVGFSIVVVGVWVRVWVGIGIGLWVGLLTGVGVNRGSITLLSKYLVRIRGTTKTLLV